MDPVSISSAYTGLKAAKDMLQALVETKIDVASLAKVSDALGKLGQTQDALFEMRDELFSLQHSKEELTRKLAESEDWQRKFAGYTLVNTPGGATVFAASGDTPHFICPSCVNKRELQILQDTRTLSGHFGCPGCKVQFPIKSRKPMRIDPHRLA